MYEDIDDAIRVAEARRSEGFVGCVTVRLDVLKLWRERIRNLEAWQNEIRITRTVYNPPPGDAIHAAVALADAGQLRKGST